MEWEKEKQQGEVGIVRGMCVHTRAGRPAMAELCRTLGASTKSLNLLRGTISERIQRQGMIEESTSFFKAVLEMAWKVIVRILWSYSC